MGSKIPAHELIPTRLVVAAEQILGSKVRLEHSIKFGDATKIHSETFILLEATASFYTLLDLFGLLAIPDEHLDGVVEGLERLLIHIKEEKLEAVEHMLTTAIAGLKESRNSG